MNAKLVTEGNVAFKELQKIGLVEKGVLYSEYKETQREPLLAGYSTSSKFVDDEWIIDKKENEMNFSKAVRTIKFSSFPPVLRDEIKDWTLSRLLEGRKLKGISANLNDLKCFFSTIKGKHIYEVEAKDILLFYDRLLSSDISDSTISRRWNVLLNFFRDMGCDKQAEIMLTYIVPKWEKRKVADKYIPTEAAARMDAIFTGTQIPLTYRCIYWTMRLFPNRVEEVVSIHTDALVKTGDDSYVLAVPVSKTAGYNDIPEMKYIKIIYQGIGKYYVDLLLQQIDFTRTNMPDSQFLFASRKVCYKKNIVTKEYGYEETGQKVYPVHEKMVQAFFWRFGPRFNIRDDDGRFVNITTHKFRHNAVTDRLRSGIFTRLDVMYETGHKNTAMLDSNYAHAAPPERLPVAFRGKITESQKRMTMLLSRPYAKEIYHLGICADIRQCTCDRAACLTCQFLQVDKSLLPFMKRDKEDWVKKRAKSVSIGNDSFTAICDKWINGYDYLFERITKEAENG